MAVRDAGSERCDILGGVGTDPDVHRIEWELSAAASPAESARLAQAYNRPLIGTEWRHPARVAAASRAAMIPSFFMQ